MDIVTPPEDPSASSIDIPKESPRTILFQFVVFPLAVVAVGVGVFLLFGMLASERHAIPEYVNEIRAGSSHARWQAAYQLSKSLKRGEAKQYPALAGQIIDIYRNAKNDDPKVRQYLSVVLGTLADKAATPVLLDGAGDRDPESRIYAIWALGEVGDPRAFDRLAQLTQDQDHDVRKTAVYAIGRLQDRRAVPILVTSLNDTEPDVRWNAALALSRFHDRRAVPQLEGMIERDRLAHVEGLREDQKAEVMISGMSAYAGVLGKESVPLLKKVADGDPNTQVRAAAKSLLQQLGS